jgi:hypothetical protein
VAETRKSECLSHRACKMLLLLAGQAVPAMSPDARDFRPGLSAGPGSTLIAKVVLWQQSDNVLFEQSRNVLLTTPSWGDARRTTTDDTR